MRFIMVSPGIDFHDGNTLDYSREASDGGGRRPPWTARSPARSPGPWSGMHAPCLSMGKYDCQAGRDFTNLLIDKKADLVLTGHDHIYQRSTSWPTAKLPGAGAGLLFRRLHRRLGRRHGPGRRYRLRHCGNRRRGTLQVNERIPKPRYFAAWSGKTATPPSAPWT